MNYFFQKKVSCFKKYVKKINHFIKIYLLAKKGRKIYDNSSYYFKIYSNLLIKYYRENLIY